MEGWRLSTKKRRRGGAALHCLFFVRSHPVDCGRSRLIWVGRGGGLRGRRRAVCSIMS